MVVDYHNNRIQKFDANGEFLATWGSRGDAEGQFFSPYGIAVDDSGNVYVTDRGRVQKFGPDGVFLIQWGPPEEVSESFEKGIAVDHAENVYVVDGLRHRIQKFTSDGSFLATFGSRGGGDGEFEFPVGIGVDGVGNVYVVDSENHRVQKFNSNGEFVTKWGSQGSGDGQFQHPYDIAVNDTGDVYVVDSENFRVQKFDYDGVFRGTVGSREQFTVDGVSPNWPGPFGNSGYQGINERLEMWDFPYGIAVDNSGNLYVTEPFNHRAQVVATQPLVAGLVLWLTSDAGIIIDGSGNVQTWADQSGNGNDFIQNSASARPTLVTAAGPDGADVLHFDGLDDVLATPAQLVAGTSVTVFSVMAVREPGFPWALGTPVGDRMLYEGHPSGSVTGPDFFDVAHDNSHDARASLPGINDDTYKILTITGSGTIHDVRVFMNGAPANMSGTGSNVPLDFSPGNALGFVHTTANPFTEVDFAEFIVYDRELSETERVSVESYLANRYFPGQDFTPPYTSNHAPAQGATGVYTPPPPSPVPTETAIPRLTLVPTPTPISWSFYSNPFEHYSLEYPTSWSVNETRSDIEVADPNTTAEFSVKVLGPYDYISLDEMSSDIATTVYPKITLRLY